MTQVNGLGSAARLRTSPGYPYIRLLAAGVASVFVVACSDDDSAPDGASADSGIVRDAALPDASAVDGHVPDARVPDAQVPDASVPDASVPDATPANCGYAGNLITNCGFEPGTTGWSAAFNSTIAENTSEAHLGTSSMQMEMVGLPGQSNWSANYDTCFALSANTTYAFGAWAREIGGTAVNFCHAQLRVYPGVVDCSGGASTHFSPTFPVDSSWNTSEGSYAVSATGDSVRIHIRCQGGAAGSQILVDDIYLR